MSFSRESGCRRYSLGGSSGGQKDPVEGQKNDQIGGSLSPKEFEEKTLAYGTLFGKTARVESEARCVVQGSDSRRKSEAGGETKRRGKEAPSVLRSRQTGRDLPITARGERVRKAKERVVRRLSLTLEGGSLVICQNGGREEGACP